MCATPNDTERVNDEPLVEVWDGCFAADTLCSLRTAGAQRCFDFITVMRRGTGETVLDAAVDSVLDELGDTSPFVEYWWRGEACDVLAHRDIDEKHCRRGERLCQAGQQRCPSAGHVLYLQVEEGLAAPTCVWEEIGTGAGAPRQLRAIHAVPAVTNRLLRFRGDALHSVPQPALAYLPSKCSTNDRSGQPHGARTTEATRAVLLFNTWHDPPTPSLFAPREEYPILAASTATPPRCLPRKLWRRAAAQTPSEDGMPRESGVRVCAPLLGDAIRRNTRDTALVAHAEAEALRAALLSRHVVHAVRLAPPPPGWLWQLSCCGEHCATDESRWRGPQALLACIWPATKRKAAAWDRHPHEGLL